ncbi:MAG: bifunctional phosphopantothenoylcysteine decarboxylase/phosphopantothenate--cysteine ligase CoaBC [Candidatus Cloacimonetes bacterium]|nr:bifunctional phosphopantothenoylcysteine decarboxylase/phosphopantothenate--cysteine ligase CoaBC [Candidatus Cloacimonadota bacterium]MBL7107765.1 bifunctional phosphopantothenoylcysteine decarboxylase/phosphopantothenate--cysteine ligase CoaBC [Candidatus Cloacimonadota bacterium]
MLKNKKILVGISAGIAAYKIPLLISQLKKNGAEVKVIMTKNATNIITPLTLQTISENPVAVEMFQTQEPLHHISLADWADLILIAPATANIIGKVANGIADDLLSTTIIASKAKTIFVPSMNVNMLENPIVQKNIQSLKEANYSFIEPEIGQLACGYEGKGRLPEISEIVKYIKCWSEYACDFSGKKVLVTAGSTREYWDDLRFLANNSTGKLGYALAKSAQIRGAKTTLITGQTNLTAPRNVSIINVISAKKMHKEVIKNFSKNDIIIMTAAVADFSFTKKISGKHKKKNEDISLKLSPTVDILKELGKKKSDSQILVGFALENEDLIKNAYEKLKRKNLDMIIANPLKVAGSEKTSFTIITKQNQKDFSEMEKFEAANIILDYTIKL